ncbi:hypothetical protein M8818_001727 [Zalaria obscura]|uniref:Uncharacterized protein n=1 Tax=Zalaria obscura TaxID=2024903 RepID=A0ACC3SJV2_9PEZI
MEADRYAGDANARAMASLSNVKGVVWSRKPSLVQPTPSHAIGPTDSQTLRDLQTYLTQAEEQRGTVLYLAYGSNLSNETFRGNRGIKPLSQVNVQVPELRLTFDLPGIPYGEPCFANTARRDPNNDPPADQNPVPYSEKSPLFLSDISATQDYHKDRWHKGLVGVVYEVTPEDYAHIIATEGGGSSYHDILVDCYPFSSSDPATPVPYRPNTAPFRAHTLFAPATQPGEQPPEDGGRFQRPDTSYAQPSARYLKLITDGASECKLPHEYQDYLNDIRPYTVTTQKQRLGQYVFLSLWAPIVFFVLALQKAFSNEKGQSPQWVKLLAGAIFSAVWGSYDGFFKNLFGDGERTIPKKGDEEDPPLSNKEAWSERQADLLSSPGQQPTTYSEKSGTRSD